MLAAFALGWLLGIGSVGAAISIRRSLRSPEERDQEVLQEFAESDGGRHV